MGLSRLPASLLLLPVLAGCVAVLPPLPPGAVVAPGAGVPGSPAAPGSAAPAGAGPASGGQATPARPAASAAPAGLAPITGEVLFRDGFEAGLAKWHVNAGKRLALEAAVGGAHEGRAAVALRDADGQVPAGVADTANLVLRTPLDLSGLALPRLRFHVKGGARPESAAGVQAVWLDQATYDPALVELWSALRDIGAAAPARAAWAGRDVDLSAFKAKPGFLRLRFDVAATNGAAFPGLLVDDVVVYDAAGMAAAPADEPAPAAEADEPAVDEAEPAVDGPAVDADQPTGDADQPTFDAALVGTWDLWIPGGASTGGSFQQGADMGRLTIHADGTFTWVKRSGATTSGPLGLHGGRRQVVTDSTGDYLAVPRDGGISLLYVDLGFLAATGTAAR